MNAGDYSTKESGVSLLQMLIAVSIAAIIGSLAVTSVKNVRSSARSSKLSSDVTTINAAIKVYIANGGSIASTDSAEEVISKLKKSVSSDLAETHVGLTGALIDHRITPVWHEENSLNNKKESAVWNSSKGKFEITKDTSGGISHFVLDENFESQSDSEGVESRSSSMKYASETNWIWDYVEASNSGPAGPSVIPVTAVPPSSPPPSAPPASGPPPSGPAKLSPPALSISPGSYPIGDYRLPVALVDSNAAGISTIYYRRNGGDWTPYTSGAEFAFLPNEEIESYAYPVDNSKYEVSDLTRGNYSATPARLNLQISPAAASFTYYDLVDAMPKIELTVTNLSDFPDFVKTPGFFTVFWGSEGTDPTKAGPRSVAGAYIPGYSGDLVSVTPDFWTDNPEIEFRAYAQPEASPWILGSQVVTASLSAQAIELSPASILVEEISSNEYSVEIELPEGNPPGSRIFYNLGGDPPYWDSESKTVKGGLPYEGAFVFEPTLEDGELIDVSGGENEVSISQVVLHSKGKDIVQDESHFYDKLDDPGFDGIRDNEVVDNSKDQIELKSITIVQNGETIVADNVNVLQLTVSNFNIPAGASNNDITVKESGTVVSSLADYYSGSGNKFQKALEKTFSSKNLRDYIDYSSPSKAILSLTDFDYDVHFSPVTNNDFLVVMERFGNSTFDLRPLDASGNVIGGSNRLVFREYSWNTGYAPPDTGGQAFFFSVIDIEKFGVDTDLNTIGGFRVNNDGGADFKFFTISSEDFSEREFRFAEEIQARVFPPENLSVWFTPSTISSAEISGTATAP